MYKIITIIMLIIFPAVFSYAIENDDPSWVHLKKAENFIVKQDYAAAMTEVRKARIKKIDEALDVYSLQIREEYHEKTDYELQKMVRQKESELKLDDNFPQYHHIVGDIMLLTNFLEEAEHEYRLALQQKDYLDYKDQEIEIQYKLASLYRKKGEPDLEEMIYREILKGFFAEKKTEYWDRIKYNIRQDVTLGHVFKIYRIDGIKYLEALYMLGRREAILQKKNESLFYLSCAAIVWMTYYGDHIKKRIADFQYEGPADFLNYIKNSMFSGYITKDFIVDKIMFYIGYNFFLNREYEVMDHYFKLSIAYSDKSGRKILLSDMISYLSSHKDHILTYQELLD